MNASRRDDSLARTLLSIGGYQAVWITCALGAAAGSWWPGVAAALLFVAIQVAISTDRPALAAVLSAGAALGFAAESALVASGMVRYGGAWPWPHLAPVWIVALWIAFAATLPTLSRLLGANMPLKAALLGILLGPVAYLAAAYLGALELAPPQWPALSAIAIIWAAAMPALLAIWRSQSEAR